MATKWGDTLSDHNKECSEVVEIPSVMQITNTVLLALTSRKNVMKQMTFHVETQVKVQVSCPMQTSPGEGTISHCRADLRGQPA